ncbi:MAG: DUF3168 domain-containing protein [Polaromonas sp.]|nr:DUF3168 domain-containing protein [Polaromonas sp.]
MSLQSDLYALLNGTFTGRLYPSVAPFGAVAPYATYSRVSSIEQSTLDANGGTGNEANTRMQIDVWALSYSEASTKAEAVKTALKGWTTANIILSEQDDYEPDTLLFRVMLDLSIWHL